MRLTIRGKLSSKGIRQSKFPTNVLKSIHRYALSELRKDVEKELQSLPESERAANRTQFAIFVVHNKLKPKVGELPPDVP